MIDNSTDFEAKLNRMIQSVCVKLGIDVHDRLQNNSRKVKFLVKGPLPPDNEFPVEFRDFTVVHYYLRSSGNSAQGRLRKRGHQNHWSYTHTIRRPVHGQSVEVKTTLSARDYALMLTQTDLNHVPVFKTRRCFLLNEQYFQMDVYVEPFHPRCKGLILLETYSTLSSKELYGRLPDFLTIVKEVTGDPRYSMFNLSLKDCWENNKHFSSLLSNASTGPVVNGSSNGISTRKDGNERNESFLACCDEKSMKHHIASGCNGINGCMINGSTSGKLNGHQQNGHSEFSTVAINGHGKNLCNGSDHSGSNGGVNGHNKCLTNQKFE